METDGLEPDSETGAKHGKNDVSHKTPDEVAQNAAHSVSPLPAELVELWKLLDTAARADLTAVARGLASLALSRR